MALDFSETDTPATDSAAHGQATSHMTLVSYKWAEYRTTPRMIVHAVKSP